MSKKTTKEYLINGDNYFPSTRSGRTSVLPAGTYECKCTMDGAPYLAPIEIVSDEIIDIPNSVTSEVLEDVVQFWSEGTSAKFKQYGLIQKRGTILEGKAGTGKTITLSKVARYVTNDLKGITLFNPDVESLPEFLRIIKEIEPDRKVLILWEEFDSLITHSESKLLSLLDGEIQVSNIYYLATTNYISKIPARIKNRPSRFARVIHVDIPDAEGRRLFLQKKLHDSDSHLLEPMVEASEGFVMDQIKDLIISVCCFNKPISEAILKIKEMEEDSIGYDDYNEEHAKTVFKSKLPVRSRNPLKPL